MKRLLFIALAALLCYSPATAQIVNVVPEVVLVHDGSIAPIAAGAITYRLYIELQDADDQITAVSAIASCNDMGITTGGSSFFNSPFGADQGDAINPGLYGYFPNLVYDSWVTINLEDNTSGDLVGYQELVPGGALGASFANGSPGSDYVVSDAGWFSIPTDPNTFPVGPNNRVLIAQLTVNPGGLLNYRVNVQWRDGLTGDSFLALWDAASGDCDALLTEEYVCQLNSEQVCLAGPVNDDCVAALPIACGATLTGDNTGATPDGATGSCWLEPGVDNDIWYSFVAPAGEVVIETIFTGGNDDTQVTVYDACGGVEVACDDDGGAGFMSLVTVGCPDLVVGNTYLIQVDGYLGAAGAFDISLTCNDIPGCTDVLAINYNACATVDDLSCITPDCATPPTNYTYCYDNLDNVQFVYASDAPGVNNVLMVINAGVLEAGFDLINIYDGVGNGGALLFSGDGDVSGVAVESLGDFLTVEITSDPSYSCATGEVSPQLDYDIYCGSPAIAGCTDDGTAGPEAPCAACNYDPGAVVDDGSCEYASCAGCTDPGALNWDGGVACIDDGSCVTPACGVTDNLDYCYGNNAAPESILIVGDAINPVVIEFLGGDVEAGFDVITIYDGGTNGDPVLFSGDGDLTGLFFSTSGATDMLIEITSDASYSCQTGEITPNITANIYCGAIAIPGCTDPSFCNYNPAATFDDASCAGAFAANDDCANAVGVGLGVLTNINNLDCASPDGAAGACWFGADPTQNDVWYSFVAPGGLGNLRIETSDDGTATWNDTQLQLFDGCGGASLACDDDAGAGLYSLIEVSVCDLVAGNTYWVQVDGYNGDAGSADLLISQVDRLGCTDPLAINFDPCATIDDASCTAGVVNTAIGTEFFPNCTGIGGTTELPGNSAFPPEGGGDPDDDVWYSFVAPCDGAIKVLVDDLGGDMAVALYDDVFTNLDYGDDNAAVGEYVYTDGVQAGQTLYARVYTWGSGITAPFEICVTAFCASSIDLPYSAQAEFDACDASKCDYIPGAVNYDITYTSQGANPTLSYSTVGNNTFYTLADLGPTVIQYGDTYDVQVNTNFVDPDIGPLTVLGQIIDDQTMAAMPTTELRADFVGGSYRLNDDLRCPQACGADEYIWRLNGDPATDVSSGNLTIIEICLMGANVLPGQAYSVEIAVVYDGVQYGFGPAQPFNTDPQPVVALRDADTCGIAGPLSGGYYLRTDVFAPCAKDYTWEFTRTDVPELAFFWKKGDGVRILRVNSVDDPGTGENALVEGGTYNVRVKPEYGNFISGDNSDLTTEPTYDYTTVYGGVKEICIVGPAPVDGGSQESPTADATAVRDVDVAIDAAIYPNPTSENFVNLNLNNIPADVEKVLVDIYDELGRIVHTEQIAAGASTINTVVTFNGKLASGTYMVNITVGADVQTERLIINK